LKTIWIVGVSETPEALFAGEVEVMVRGPMGAGPHHGEGVVQRKCLCSGVTVTLRVPVAAAGRSLALRWRSWDLRLSARLAAFRSAGHADPGPKLASVGRNEVRVSRWNDGENLPRIPGGRLMEVRVAFGFTGAAFTAMVTVLEVFR